MSRGSSFSISEGYTKEIHCLLLCEYLIPRGAEIGPPEEGGISSMETNVLGGVEDVIQFSGFTTSVISEVGKTGEEAVEDAVNSADREESDGVLAESPGEYSRRDNRFKTGNTLDHHPKGIELLTCSGRLHKYLSSAAIGSPLASQFFVYRSQRGCDQR